VVDKGSVHKGWVVAWRGSAKDVRDSGLVAYVEDGHDALKDLLGFGERERICRGERVRRHAIGIGDGVEGRRAARPGVEMADDAVGLSGRVQHDCAEAVVGDVADERGEDLVVGDVGALTGGLVEAEATEPVEFEVGCEVLGVAVPEKRCSTGGRPEGGVRPRWTSLPIAAPVGLVTVRRGVRLLRRGGGG